MLIALSTLARLFSNFSRGINSITFLVFCISVASEVFVTSTFSICGCKENVLDFNSEYWILSVLTLILCILSNLDDLRDLYFQLLVSNGRERGIQTNHDFMVSNSVIFIWFSPFLYHGLKKMVEPLDFPELPRFLSSNFTAKYLSATKFTFAINSAVKNQKSPVSPQLKSNQLILQLYKSIQVPFLWLGILKFFKVKKWFGTIDIMNRSIPS